MNRKKYFLTGSILLLISLLCVFITIRLLSEIKILSEEIISARDKLSLLENFETELNRAQSIYDQHKSEIEKINTVFFNISVPVELISFLEETASSSSVSFSIDSITKGTSQRSKTTMSEIILRASATASFGDIMKFLVKLENSNFLLDILDITIRQNLQKDTEKKDNASNVVVHFSLQALTK